ncbi:MAG: biopolymer transporter Tol [Terracidiphilus sp.]
MGSRAKGLVEWVAMRIHSFCRLFVSTSLLAALAVSSATLMLRAQTPPAQNPLPPVPDWALPGSATHQQVAPPVDFHRPSTNFNAPIGVFDGQSDIGSALVPGSASFDAATGQYTINSAGYNIWYTRDEFRFLWKRMSGDVSLAADINFPDPKGYGDRKVVVMIRQSLDDDSKTAMVAEHGAGMVHLAWRPEKDTRVTDMEFRMAGRGRPGGASPDSLVTISPRRIGIEKRGDEFSIWVSLDGEPMHQFGPPIKLHLDAPFYLGIGFCSHQPETVDTAVFSNVALENKAGNVR